MRIVRTAARLSASTSSGSPTGGAGGVPANGPEQLARRVRAAGVRDERVLEAVASVPRAGFVPSEYRERAYRDEPIPIPHGQVTTQPSLMAAMLEALALEGGERVLEVGTGQGFQTAVLARLARHVFSVERVVDLAETASRNLARQGVRNVDVLVGDGTAGLGAHAPFDAIVVSAAFTRVPEPLAAQLAQAGGWSSPLARADAMRSPCLSAADVRSSAWRVLCRRAS